MDNNHRWLAPHHTSTLGLSSNIKESMTVLSGCLRSISSLRVTRIISELLECFGKPAAIRLDNGPELTADASTTWAKEQGIELRFIQPGKPNQNAFIERLNKSFREEVLNANLFNMLSEAQNAANYWLTDYNECRPHESLDEIPPARFKPRVFQPETSTVNLYIC